jgi:TonB family protein
MVLLASLSMPLLMTLADLAPTTSLAFTVHSIESIRLPANDLPVDWNSTALLAIVLLISAALILRQMWGTARWWYARRTAVPISLNSDTDLDIRSSTHVSSPVTVFSTVLVPVDFESWPATARQLAVAHERAHIRSWDFYVQWLAHLHRNLFWFNPFAWWLANRLSLLSEHVSDDAATEHVEERTTYARLLLNLVQRSSASEPLAPMVKASSLGSRIERILDDRQRAPIRRTKSLLLACTLLPIISAIASVQTAPSAIVLPRSNPQKPLSIPAYPPASRRTGEHGTVVLKLHVLEDGSVADAVIHRSSGYPDLDYAAMYESFRWRLDPGTIDGAPARMWGRFAVSFKLDRDKQPPAQP